jgi:D-mannonate dehydratase
MRPGDPTENEFAAACVMQGRGTMAFHDFIEEIQVLGKDLVERVKSLVHEGNVRRIIIRDEHGHTFMEIPVTVAAVGAVLAPLLAAVGAISALVAKFTVVVIRSDASKDEKAEGRG